MAHFNYQEVLPKLMTPEVMNALSGIHEYRGKQDVYATLMPSTMDKLCEIAKIQSTKASNEIENIRTTDERLHQLMAQKTEPRNRDEREILGYRYVLDVIHDRYRHITVSSGVLLQLHRDLYRYLNVSHAGQWKDSDNVIAQLSDSGEKIIRFIPTSAVATPHAINDLCAAYNAAIEEGLYDPLLIAALFSFDFMSIHPFLDGNGRMSRLLALLALYKNNYDIGKYISFEQEIEKTKVSYYESLLASSEGWKEGRNDYLPFVTYFLGVISACYRMLSERVGVTAKAQTNEDRIKAYFVGLIGQATKREIVQTHPQMSTRTVERILQRLQAEGIVEKVGAARSTAYRATGKAAFENSSDLTAE